MNFSTSTFSFFHPLPLSSASTPTSTSTSTVTSPSSTSSSRFVSHRPSAKSSEFPAPHPDCSLRPPCPSMPIAHPAFNSATVYPSTPSPEHTTRPAQSQARLAPGAYIDHLWQNEHLPLTEFPHLLPQKVGPEFQSRSCASPAPSTGATGCQDQALFPSPPEGSHSPPISAFHNLHCMSTPSSFRWSNPLPTPVGTPTSQSLLPSARHNATVTPAQQHTPIQSSSGGSGDDGYTSLSAPSSSVSMSHHHPSILPQAYHAPEYSRPRGMVSNGASDTPVPPLSGFSMAGSLPTQSAVFHQSMQDVFADQIGPPDTVPHLGRDSSSAVSGLGGPVSPPKQMRNSVSPKELMLADPDLSTGTRAPLFPSGADALVGYASHDNMLADPPYFDTAAAPLPTRYNFPRNQRRTGKAAQPSAGPPPDFPAHLVSMETTVEEGPAEASSTPSADMSLAGKNPSRPENTSSDLGTYTCTYHGCTQRLESPAKLQRHKREVHRHTSPTAASASTGSGTASLTLRNSQAGPHRCERVNPSTGKACNAVFSRPYDLTRHEDTIHTARKVKVRCHLCSEEKTFSRNDALTRHMRVVHPDMNWSGKVRKSKGAQ